MAHRITRIINGGIADQCGLVPGDSLVAINGEPLRDQIDYQYLAAGERLILTVETTGGLEEIELYKDADEPLGIVLSETLMARPRMCANHCCFCFIDQMPPGLRDTLYVKDDDWRLSLMMGNYITLTNLSDREFDRIVARRASPLYISVHAADGGVRARMMGNARADRIVAQLSRLKDAGIAYHCQVVLCRGVNDGAVLDDTLQTLASLYPAARSVALVPVGLTRHRDGLAPLVPYDAASATALLEQAHAWQQRFLDALGTRLVFAADELYCLSGMPLPDESAYESFPQIENGVGLLRSFEAEFCEALEDAPGEKPMPRRVCIATGVSAAPFFERLAGTVSADGFDVRVLAVANHYFGESVTVAGLLTGQDLRAALSGIDADEVLISAAMLRHEGDLFLDGGSLEALSRAVGIPVRAVPCDGAAFFSALMGGPDCGGEMAGREA